MAKSIRASVGRWDRGAVNNSDDVKTVQRLLAQAAQALGQHAYDPGPDDGAIARPPRTSATVRALEAFQSRYMTIPDGRIDVGGHTWYELLKAAGPEDRDGRNPNKGGPYFPFPQLPASSWLEPPRAFGSNRSNGARAHAGCDLYFPVGTWIYAVTHGAVRCSPYSFYCHTDALEIDHGAFIIRYGEIKRGCKLRAGEEVQAGQKIAQVGHLVGISVSSDMLHLEMYDKSAHGGLSTSEHSKKRSDGVSFHRRADLIDPTPYLNRWKSTLPTAY